MVYYDGIGILTHDENLNIPSVPPHQRGTGEYTHQLLFILYHIFVLIITFDLIASKF